MRTSLRSIGILLSCGALLAACSAPEPAPVVTVTVATTARADQSAVSESTPVPAPAEQPVPEPTEAAQPPAGAPEETFTMPSLVGMNLQLAQDTLQSLDSYLMDQTDASGLGRFQVDDSNWQVCTQDPAAGAVVPISTLVTLGSVKLAESCP